MKYWLDTEFIEDGVTIDLVSIGILAEDGREYYAISTEFDESKASTWVKENVLAQLPLKNSGFSSKTPWLETLPSREDAALGYRTRELIKQEVSLLIGGDTKPEFWGYYADYDWVVFCQLFGTMMDLPKGFPMYCRDIKQWCDQLGNPKLPEQGKGEHNALSDARWNRQAWEFLFDYENKAFKEIEQSFTKMAKRMANEVALNKYQDEEQV